MRKKNKLILIFILGLIFVLCLTKSSNYINIEKYPILTEFYSNNFKNRSEKHKYYSNLNVDNVYCIVMPQRKEYMKNVLNKMKINYTLFNAITPKDISNDNYNELSSTNTKGSRLYGLPTRLALQLSFTLCFMDAISNGYKTIIILEDDIIVNTDISNLNNYIDEFKKSDYVFFYMGYCFMNCNQNFYKSPQGDYGKLIDVVDKSASCTHAICYKVEYLKELIEFIYPMDNNFDHNITDFIKDKNYKICISNKTLFDQNRDELGTLNDDSIHGKLPDCNKIFN